MSSQHRPLKPLRSGVAGGLAAIAVVLLSVGGFLSLRDYAQKHPQPLIAAVETPDRETSQKPQYLSKNIRDLQVMQDRVLADNPLDDEAESPLGEIVPAEWRVVRLEHTEPNGTRHIIERGMPLDELTTVTARTSSSIDGFKVDDNWQPGDPLPEYFDESGFPIDPSVVAAMLAEQSEESDELVESPLIVGSTVEVDLPEHGISGLFTITAILPCPTPNPDEGFLVTTKFIHENAEILDLRIEGSDEPIGTTASHPFWSEDRQQFVAAGDLQIGENLLLADDTTRPVESITRRENRETVYNIEVDGEHVFYVSDDGVLVHNTCPRTVIIGENARRLGAFAQKIDGSWVYNPRRMFTVGKNIRWLKDRIREGSRILDLGLDVQQNRWHTPFYLAEDMYLRQRGFTRKFIGLTEIDGRTFRLFEWVR